MAFSIEKVMTVTLTAKDYLLPDVLHYTEFKGDDDRDYLLQVTKSEAHPNPRDRNPLFKWVTTPEFGYSDYEGKKRLNLEDFKSRHGNMVSKAFRDNNLVFQLFLDREEDIDIVYTSKEWDLEADFDTGLVGFAYVRTEDAMKELHSDNLDKQAKDKLFETLQNEIRKINAVNKGEIYDIHVTDLLAETKEDYLGCICLDKDDIRDCADDCIKKLVDDADKRKTILEELLGADERELEKLEYIKFGDKNNFGFTKNLEHIQNYNIDNTDMSKGYLGKYKTNKIEKEQYFVLIRYPDGKVDDENCDYWLFNKDFSGISAKEFVKQWDLEPPPENTDAGLTIQQTPAIPTPVIPAVSVAPTTPAASAAPSTPATPTASAAPTTSTTTEEEEP